jgi:transposase
MKVLHRRCAGLDVHKEEVVACVRVVKRSKATHEVRRFATTTRGLLELADWVQTNECTHVAIEATGVYWKLVWHVLEGHAELVLANAAHIKNVPGRKSDVNDAVWIADLLAHGLIRSSMVPPTPIQEMRDLTRTRQQLTREVVQHTQRIQKVLEDANVKLSSVVSDVLGASGRRLIEAILAGETDPEKLAALGNDRLHCSRAQLVEALRGRITDHHRFMLRQHLRMIDELDRSIGEFDRRIEVALEPFRDDVERLTAIPGVSVTAAQVILAEIGADRGRVPHGWTSALVGGPLPWTRRERRQAPLDARAQGGTVAQDGAGAVRVGGRTRQGDVPARPVSSPQGAQGAEESRRRRRGLDPRGHLPHAAGQGRVPRPRPRLLRPPRQRPRRAAPGAADPGTWL